MKLIIIDLKTDIEVELTNKETFNDINLNHKISVKYLDKNNNIKEIEGVVCSIEHKFDIDETRKTYINIY